MSIGAQIGMGRNVAAKFVSGSPDGVLSGTMFSQAIDTANGVTWQNVDGGMTWEPIAIPFRAGVSVVDEMWTTTSPMFSISTGGGTTGLDVVTDTNRPGQFHQIAVAAGVDGHRYLLGNSLAVILGGGGAAWIDITTRLTVLSDGTNNGVARLGLGDTATALLDHTDGVYFENDLSTYGDNRWRIATASNGARTKTDSAIAPVANVFQRLQIKLNATWTLATFAIDGISAGSISSTIPVGAGRQTSFMMLMSKSLGAGSWQVAYDVISYRQVFTTRR